MTRRAPSTRPFWQRARAALTAEAARRGLSPPVDTLVKAAFARGKAVAEGENGR